MTKQERIKLDRKTFYDMGFKKVKFIALYDYFNNIELCTTKYEMKKGKEKFTQYLFNKDINPDIIWEQIDKELDYDILSVHTDFVETGILYNVLVDKDKIKSILLIKYNPTNGKIDIKEAEIDAKANK